MEATSKMLLLLFMVAFEVFAGECFIILWCVAMLQVTFVDIVLLVTVLIIEAAGRYDRLTKVKSDDSVCL